MRPSISIEAIFVLFEISMTVVVKIALSALGAKPV